MTATARVRMRAHHGAPHLLELLSRASNGHLDPLVGIPADPSMPTPGTRLADGDQLCRPATIASWEDRSDYLCALAGVVRAFHSCGAPVADSLARIRWVDGMPPTPWLPVGGQAVGRPSGGDRLIESAADPAPRLRSKAPSRPSRAQDRAELARVARMLLDGPSCPPEVASLLRRAALAPAAAPLPLEWILALRAMNAGRPDPVPWVDAGALPRSGPVALTLVLLDGTCAATVGQRPWTGPPYGAADRVVVLAGRHAERLVASMHAPGPITDTRATGGDALQPGPELEANLREAALEAALLLDADGITLASLAVRAVGSSSASAASVAALAAQLRDELVGSGRPRAAVRRAAGAGLAPTGLPESESTSLGPRRA